MALVNYAASDESGIESDSEEGFIAVKLEEMKKEEEVEDIPAPRFSGNDGKRGVNPKPNSSNAPHSSSHMSSINFDMKILDKNRSQPIRITIPALKDFEEEEPKKPKLQPSTKGSSLFSILPAPKNVTSTASTSLMPQSVSKAQKPKAPAKRPAKSSGAAAAKKQKEEEEEDTSGPLTSFFFSGADDEPLPPPIDIDIDTPMIGATAPEGSASMQSQVASASNKITAAQLANVEPFEASQAGNSQAETFEDQTPIDVDALRKICGTKDRKKGPDLSDIIDVSGSSLVGDAALTLAKELSKEQPTSSFKRKSECSSRQRRKHQITYLAEQAKAQELELRNNWAQNRMTRKQTQAKYGF